MIQLRPTFSESWYRVATLKARLRSSAQISRQFYRGERWYVVRDPAGNQFHRLSDAAYRFIGLLDGTRTVEEAWDICGGQLADDAPTQPEIIQILSHLYSANLIEADVTPDATVLLRRHKQLNKRKMQNRLMNVLFPRIPLWDPDSFLVRWMPVMRQVFSWFGAVIWIVVVLTGLALMAPQWQSGELQKAAKSAVDPSNWLWLWAVFVGIKAIHELGHAFACRRFGGECHELGIMFLVFIPTPYVDASAAWAFPSRWQRMFVGCAGMIVELWVASVLAIIWTFIRHDTLPGQLMYNAMLIASVSTIIFNANPLLRYDGYYILSDFLEIPNLRQKSTEYALGLIKRHVFGVKANQPLPPVGQRFWLFTYATASSIYRVFVGFVIILVVAYKIPILGVLMAIGGVATWLLVPVGKLSKYLLLEPELHRKRGRATAFCGALAIAAVLCIGVLRFPVYVDAPGIAEADQHAVVHTKGGGFVTRVVAHDGELVHKGQTILVCHDPKVETELKSLKAELAGLEAQLVEAEAIDQSQRRVIEASLYETRHELADARRRQAELTITAPITGTLVAPHLADMAGSYLPRGTEVASVESMDSLVIRAVTDQDDHQLVAEQAVNLLTSPPDDQSPTRVCFAGDVQRVVPGHVYAIVAGSQDQVPHPSDLQTGGGTIAPDPTDPKGMTPQVKQFEVDVRVNNPTDAAGGQLYPGQAAYVRFRIEKKPLLYTWTRRFLQLLQSHENDSKLT
jgi:putative peptide zinc metalloprotease protein